MASRRPAQYGEEGGEPVPFLATPTQLCSYFGSAVGMYFWTAQLFCVVFLLLAVLSLPAIYYLGEADIWESAPWKQVRRAHPGSR
jgi:hypothetical protein